MSNAVKKAISLPKDQDLKIQKLSKATGVSYSKILQEAVEAHLRRKDYMVMEEEYARYYGNPKNIEDDRKIIDELWELSQDVWDKQ